ncbi:nitrate reductase subunit beta [Georgenia subflava]|uniref:nitrate reductase subunit beta n=1 Tax=Georgenia subflava TaxID=1622177 RepID=UPI001D022766|nr:nitrate reductase subunit beta [Georgenia subflava]
MKVMAQMSMVMNIDKCIGCHTCSVTCKQAWTNRTGMEYVWFNNVETRPGLGYPRRYEDQEEWQGGWVRNKRGKLKLRAGGRLKKLATIFSNPKMPTIQDYYEPWTYEYDMLLSAPADSRHTPVARPKSLLTGEDHKIEWSANWDDNLGGSQEIATQDPVLKHMSDHVAMEFEKSFMFYLPRICEHCLNPSCVASCPSGAIYKREEDGIVLVDQEQCRGWRMCITGCPYKKMYFNHKTGKAEKCTLCYPRIEVGLPTVCSETCVGRLRYIGLVLYDADRVGEAAAVENEHDLLAAQRSVFLDPHDPEVVAAARRDGIAEDWITAAQSSPIWKLISDYEIALPLHPEYRTLPMVWYVPPLSPVVDVVTSSGNDGEDAKTLLTAISTMRIPLEYLAELFSAGDTGPVEKVLRRLAAMRSYMRDINLGNAPKEETAAAVGMTGAEIEAMYRLLAIAKYEDRYVIPTAHAEAAANLEEMACSLDFEGGPGMGGSGPFGSSSGQPSPASVENFHALKQRQTADDPHTPTGPTRVNLLNWDGRGGRTDGLFPPQQPLATPPTALAVADPDAAPGTFADDPYPGGFPGVATDDAHPTDDVAGLAATHGTQGRSAPDEPAAPGEDPAPDARPEEPR